MVIVVLGILAALSIPRLDRDLTQEASDTVLSAIRYTQHMALLDDKHKFDDTQWQREFWRIEFESCADNGTFLSIGSDTDHDGSLDSGDDTASENIFLYKKYGVRTISGSGGCDGLKHIGFDHLGRPHVSFSGSTQPNYASYMSTACIFKFDLESGDSFQIQIEPETGYAHIL